MRIKRLDITGFKSFMDRSVFQFGEGITGVVGPNGCGKSNVVDAIRWVMGEQSAKNLRGRGMEDVIFNGSESMPPLSMAEVTLTFAIENNDVMPPTFAGLPEVSVTRRLFRSGESEYQLNKTTCRLLDITELFLGTGVGTRAYSIIEQGRVGQIVSARPEDRRSFIEEAAGVTRYKARRKAAERKLEHTQQNLLRVNDVVAELKQRLDSLDRQVKKAEKYKKLRGQMRQIELHQLSHRWLELLATRKVLEAQLSQLSEQERESYESLKVREADLSARRDALEAQTGELQAMSASVHELSARVQLAAQNEQHWQADAKSTEARVTNASNQVATLTQRLDESNLELQSQLEQSSALTQSSSEDDVQTDVVKEELRRVLTLTSEVSSRLERERAELVDTATRVANHESNLTNIQARGGELQGRIEKLHGEAEVLRVEESQLEQSREEVQTRVGSSRQAHAELSVRKSDEEQSLEKTREAFSENEIQLICVREELADKRSRLHSLEEIQRNYEGFDRGVRAVMLSAGEDPRAQGVFGLVSDVITAPPEYEKAVEAALAERLQYVVVESGDKAFDWVERLKSEAGGRATFLPVPASRMAAAASVAAEVVSVDQSVTVDDSVTTVDASVTVDTAVTVDTPVTVDSEQSVPAFDDRVLEPTAFDDAPAVTDAAVVEALQSSELSWADVAAAAAAFPAGVLRASDVVRAHDESLSPVIALLLENVGFVTDLAAARAAYAIDAGRTYVTLEGELLRSTGAVTGGALEGPAVGALQKKREISELHAEVTAVESRYNEVVTRHYELQKQMGHTEGVLKGLSRHQHAEELSLATHEKDLHVAGASLVKLRERLAVLDSEEAQLRQSLGMLGDDEEGLKGELMHATTDRESREERVRLLTGELETLKARTEQFVAEQTALQVKVASASEKKSSLERTASALQTRVEELAGQIAQADAEKTEGQARLEELQLQLSSVSGQQEIDRASLLEQQSTLDTRQRAHAEAMVTVRAEENELKGLREQVGELAEGLSQISLREREIAIELEHVVGTVRERHAVGIDEAVFEFHLAPRLATESEKELKDLRSQVERMGEVNLTAIEEHKEIAERYAFLAKQKDDLDQSIDQLHDAIKKIDATSRERFAQTFEVVNEKFQQIFPRLFGGGRAQLVLTQEVGQEQGVEIVAQPPGKKLQSVTLLSGGEKALTAVGMIFAIFLIKPTPFCLLDEVDAPLDEANVGRYNDMVREMSRQSQFILITHNKRTMEIVDNLYGVTMEEPGISKLVSVRMSDAAAANTDQPNVA